jgi:hypothetical protein
VNGDLGSTQILTQLVNSETTPTRQVSIIQPLRVIKTPADGVDVQVAPPFDTEPWGIMKSSAQNKAIHMELSIRLSFQLRRSLGGYTVGTTAGFQIETMEALAP